MLPNRTIFFKQKDKFLGDFSVKIRAGFVSNSSSSSFVVPIKTSSLKSMFGQEETPLLDKNMIEKLLSLGFVYSKFPYPMDNYIIGPKRYTSSRPSDSLAIDVVCNQDEIIAQLVKLNVSFKGVCHYGHESVFFKAGDKEVTFVPNYGMVYEMYHWDPVEGQTNYVNDFGFKDLKKSIRKVPIKEYLSED
jgi:hypothetical protein